MKNENASGTETYWSHVADAASVQAYRGGETDPLLSAETLPSNSSLIDFKSFAAEYPEKLFPLLDRLRPEFKELFVEYYLLGKSQSFLAKCHGFIQTRAWQSLRIIEQAVGSLIVLGTNPTEETLRGILENAGIEETELGSLAAMVFQYAQCQSYRQIAEKVHAPVPAIRKIFRPAITTLLASKDLQTVAVGAYLRSLTHQASLTKGGLSKSCLNRLHRVQKLKFEAPPFEDSPLISFGAVSSLHDAPWAMFEISSEGRMAQIYPLLRKAGKKLFGQKAAQIFAPRDADGELKLGYILARSVNPGAVRGLLRVRGISEMSALYDDDGNLKSAVTVPDADVQPLIKEHAEGNSSKIRVKDFVEVLTGDAARYYGTVAKIKSDAIVVEINFPTERQFVVTADSTAVRVLPATPVARRAFWGPTL